MLKTRLTEKLGIDHPVIQAPMAMAAGGRLAASVANAGGLGMIGGAYCDPAWINAQFAEAGNTEVGCGFITWALARQPKLLTHTLARKPKAIFLSFADPVPFAEEIRAAKVPLIVQVQKLSHAKRAVEAGADIIVAQGSEAGGHGAVRGTVSLTTEIADMLAKTSPDTLLVAAGGIADGRGLAASLMLGADGVVVGSRFWASTEALVHEGILASALEATGDDTIRTNVVDIIRELDWPPGYTCRVLNNAFTQNWHADHDGLRANLEREVENWKAALAQGNAGGSNTIVGEVTGLINEVIPAADILGKMVEEAKTLLQSANRFVR